MESLADRGEAADEEDDRNVADLLLDQIEFADVVVLNKADLVGEAEQRRLLGLLRSLNPEAQIITAVNSEVDMAAVINTGRFSFEKAARSAGWLKASLIFCCPVGFSLPLPILEHLSCPLLTPAVAARAAGRHTGS